jgi:cytochrome P450 family 724 subfamily B1
MIPSLFEHMVAHPVIPRAMSIRYGSVFKSHLFGEPTVVSCDTELNQLVFQNEERLFQCSYPGSVRGILGRSSLFFITGERHRKIRGLSVAFAASTGLRPAYLTDVDRTAHDIIASWQGHTTAFAFCVEARKVLQRDLKK